MRVARRVLALLVVLAATRVPETSATPLFPPALAGVGARPEALVTRDLNGDGWPDLATANAYSDDVSILLGQSDGSFGTQRTFPAGRAPISMVAGDFDTDGVPDLAVANESSLAVSVLRGRGDGSFDPPLSHGGILFPSGLAAADLDGDSRLDLIAASQIFAEITVLLGRGDGTFSAMEPFHPGSDPVAVGARDLDRDGRVDLVVAGRYRLAVLAGNGDGTFSGVFVDHTPTGAVSLVVGDFDDDDTPDVVLAGEGGGCDTFGVPAIAVYRGLGDGTLALAATLDDAALPAMIASGDFDGDQTPDLVLSRTECFAEGRGQVSFHGGLGDGTFRIPVRSAAGYFPGSLVAGDFDHDGEQDLAVASPGANYVSVLSGQGDGRFGRLPPSPASFPVGDAPAAVLAVDLNHDGLLDLATANDVSHDVAVLLGTGGGRFGAAAHYGVGLYPQSLLAADLNGDGHLDLVSDDRLLLGRGDGTFGSGGALAAGYRPLAVASGDFNGDGRADLAVADAGDFNDIPGAVHLFLGDADGFLPAGRLEAGDAPVSLATADLDRDGETDLAVVNAIGAHVSLFIGNGDGTFRGAGALDTPLLPRSVVVSDLDRDAIPDLIVGGFDLLPTPRAVTVFPGLGDGTFGPPESYVAGSSALGLLAADLDADGDVDLAAANYEADSVSILRNRGDGRLEPQEVYFAGDAPLAIASGDLDGDARNDLVVANALIPGGVSLLSNQGPFPNRRPIAAPAAEPSVECTSPEGAPVTLDGEASSDPDSSPGTSDDIVAYEWFEDAGLPSARRLGAGARLQATLPLGTHALTLRVTDRSGATGTGTVVVEVVDTTAPDVTVRISPNRIWPPRHQMVQVRALVTATDRCGPAAVILESVTSNEANDHLLMGDGVTHDDVAGADLGTEDFSFLLRAERAPGGLGRIYTVRYRASDASGNPAFGEAAVTVPRDAAGLPRPVRPAGSRPRNRGSRQASAP